MGWAVAHLLWSGFAWPISMPGSPMLICILWSSGRLSLILARTIAGVFPLSCQTVRLRQRKSPSFTLKAHARLGGSIYIAASACGCCGKVVPHHPSPSYCLHLHTQHTQHTPSPFLSDVEHHPDLMYCYMTTAEASVPLLSRNRTLRYRHTQEANVISVVLSPSPLTATRRGPQSVLSGRAGQESVEMVLQMKIGRPYSAAKVTECYISPAPGLL